jgi:rabenosyn-5
MCKECKHTVFSRNDFAKEASKVPQDARIYQNLVEFERGIRLMLPKFQRLLATLQDPDKPPAPDQINEASRVRKRLMDTFQLYDRAARQIRDLPTSSETQKKLQKTVYQSSTNFLHLHMLPLKSLPKMLKHATPHPGHVSRPSLTSNGSSRPTSALASIKYSDNLDASSQASGHSSVSAISQMEEEEKALRDRLIILEEQKFFVGEMIAQANKKRKFDEVSALASNVQDLSREIDQIQGQLAQLDFAGAYSGLASPGPRPAPKR